MFTLRIVEWQSYSLQVVRNVKQIWACCIETGWTASRQGHHFQWPTSKLVSWWVLWVLLSTWLSYYMYIYGFVRVTCVISWPSLCCKTSIIILTCLYVCSLWLSCVAIVLVGVRYAQPPVGKLRFSKPQPHPGWTGVVDAIKPGRIASQMVDGGEHGQLID